MQIFEHHPVDTIVFYVVAIILLTISIFIFIFGLSNIDIFLPMFLLFLLVFLCAVALFSRARDLIVIDEERNEISFRKLFTKQIVRFSEIESFHYERTDEQLPDHPIIHYVVLDLKHTSLTYPIPTGKLAQFKRAFEKSVGLSKKTSDTRYSFYQIRLPQNWF